MLHRLGLGFAEEAYLTMLNPHTTSSSKETYGFRSTKNPPPIKELKDFEDDMLEMIQSVKFKQVNNPFFNKLKEDTDRIKNEPKLLIAADKTTNFYKLEPSTYNDMLEKNITKSYKKAQPETTQAIHKGRDTLGDKSLRHVAGTSRRNKSPCVTRLIS